jgi:murein DD-endopeptidase MepM/ murein hydrolase activator NlpD
MRSALPARLRVAALACGITTLGACHLPRWPVEAPIVSGYGLRMRGAWPDVHHGVDLDVPTGTPVRAMAEARVRFAGVMSGFGTVVWLDHGGGTLTIYAHLSEIHVRQGARVGAGDTIGLSGATGNATTPHLHFEVWKWGRAVDPIPQLGGAPR